jgi:hypothetical protein
MIVISIFDRKKFAVLTKNPFGLSSTLINLFEEYANLYEKNCLSFEVSSPIEPHRL